MSAKEPKFPKAIVAFVDALHADHLGETSVSKDWSTGHALEEGDPGWCFWEASRCEKCNEAVVLTAFEGGTQHSDIDHDSECDGSIRGGEGPQMNYWYPLDLIEKDPAGAAKKIVDLPLCVVDVDGAFGLALTGGGTDLSWEICAAYVTLGQCPPVHFASRLPRVAAMTLDADRLRVIAAARKGLEVEASRAARGIADVDSLLREMRKTTRAKKTATATSKKAAKRVRK